MKNKFIIFLSIMPVFVCFKSFTQTVIDLRTGIIGNNINSTQQMPSGLPDDTWLVSPVQPVRTVPIPPLPVILFQSAFVSNGVGFATVCGPYTFPPLPQNLGSKFISPYVNPSSGRFTDAPLGEYFYKMTFDYHPCESGSTLCYPEKIKSATFNIKYLKVDDFYLGMRFNNVYAYPQFSGQGSLNNISFSIPVSQINIGQNSIIIEVANQGCFINNPNYPNASISPTGLEIDGNLIICTYGLTDKDGIEKSVFCIGEDVFFDGGYMNATSYDLDLFSAIGNTHLASVQGLLGSANWLDITSIFEKTPNNFVFQTGQGYTVKVTANTACGPAEFEKDFSYECCGGSLDASFDLTTNNGNKLVASSSAKGTHLWTLFNSSNVNTGPYTNMGTLNQKMFSRDIVQGAEPCYYLSHKLTNVCGEACAAESVCNVTCEGGACNMNTPILSYILSGNQYQFTWNAIPSASSYVIEITSNGCCGPASMSNSNLNSIPILTNSYITNLFGTGNIAECYLIKVYAICEDGSRSNASNAICITR